MKKECQFTTPVPAQPIACIRCKDTTCTNMLAPDGSIIHYEKFVGDIEGALKQGEISECEKNTKKKN